MTYLSIACDAIDEFARSVSRVRYSPGTYVAGKWTDGVASTSTILAVHQPVSSRDLRDFPEGQRIDALRAVWSRSDILGADETTGRRADEFLIEGETWRVVRLWPRTEAGFYKAIVELSNDRQRGI